MARMESQERIEKLLNAATNEVITREKNRQDRYQRHSKADIASKGRNAAHRALRWSRAHYRDHIRITEQEHMSPVDCYDGSSVRKTQPHVQKDVKESLDVSEDDLVTIHPVVDGRFKDEGRK